MRPFAVPLPESDSAGRAVTQPFRLFYASDIHGSEKCFLKFVNAGKFYKAQALVLGGDITGKMVVPLIRRGGRYEARFLGRDFSVESDTERAELEKLVRMNGFYPVTMSPEEHAHCQADETARQALIDRLILESVERWIAIAESRLANTGIRCLINAGNDDEDYVDAALRRSGVVENHDGEVVRLDDDLEMLICGYSNRTPFDSPREMDEPALEAHIRDIAAGLGNPARTIFTLHVPPYNSGLEFGAAARGRKDRHQGRAHGDGGGRLDRRAPDHRGDAAAARPAWACARIARDPLDRPHALHQSRQRIQRRGAARGAHHGRPARHTGSPARAGLKRNI